MRFIVDMPLSPALARWLREVGHDAVHAAQIGLATAQDREILRHALAEGRTIVTADLDYPALLARLGAVAPSVVLFRDGQWTDAEVMERMDDVLRALRPSALDRCIVVVEKKRIRRRELPLR